MKLRKITALAAASVAALALGLVGTAGATTVTPKISLPQPTFTDLTGDPSYWNVGFVMKWTVTAPNGVCHQYFTDQDYNDLGGDTDPVLGGNTSTYTIPNSARSYSLTDGDFMDFMRGGYNAVDRITECNGTKITSNPVHTVLQVGDDQYDPYANNASFYSPGVYAWHTANCTCFFGGTSTWTNTKGAYFSFLTPQPLDSTGARVVLQMPKGPGRGSAAVYVDNVYKTTINTYATTNINGKFNYSLLLTGTHQHLIRVVNLATAGHPRIDLDAFLN